MDWYEFNALKTTSSMLERERLNTNNSMSWFYGFKVQPLKDVKQNFARVVHYDVILIAELYEATCRMRLSVWCMESR